jgi:pimeloyl-ACP methyl ester carboxylesterase
MTTVLAATDPRSAVASESGPIARVVAISLLTGLITALLLTLVVFAGAGESTILGSALLAFATGWALLARWSARRTGQPQRWAIVPAGAMAATGAAVLGLAPGDSALTALGWVWPPALLVLAVWTARQARQHLHTRARTWLVLPVVGSLALSALGGAYETVRLSADSRSIHAPGRIVDIGGRNLHLQCSGTGSPVVVLSSGLGEHSTSWSWITAEVSKTTTVCAYDRAGQVWSDDSSVAPDGVAIARDLHAILHAAGLAAPYVMVGHSTGGLYTQVFADRYPSEVAGMVLLDSLTPRAMTALPHYPAFYNTFRRASALLPTLARIGATQLIYRTAGSTLPPPARRAEHAIASSPREQRSARAEFVALRATFTQAQRLASLGDKPLAVITSGVDMAPGWAAEQLRMSRLSTSSVRRTVPFTHEGMIVERAGASVSSAAIAEVVQAVRTHSGTSA